MVTSRSRHLLDEPLRHEDALIWLGTPDGIESVRRMLSVLPKLSAASRRSTPPPGPIEARLVLECYSASEPLFRAIVDPLKDRVHELEPELVLHAREPDDVGPWRLVASAIVAALLADAGRTRLSVGGRAVLSERWSVLAGAPIDVTIADHDVQPETRAARKGLDELFESLERMAPEDLEFGLERYASYDYDALVTRYVGARLIDDVDHLADRGYRIVRAKRDDEAWQQGLPFVMRAVGAAIIDVILGDRLPPTIATDFDRPFARPVLHVPSIDPFGPADIEADPAFIAAVDKIRA